VLKFEPGVLHHVPSSTTIGKKVISDVSGDLIVATTLSARAGEPFFTSPTMRLAGGRAVLPPRPVFSKYEDGVHDVEIALLRRGARK